MKYICYYIKLKFELYINTCLEIHGSLSNFQNNWCRYVRLHSNNTINELFIKYILQIRVDQYIKRGITDEYTTKSWNDFVELVKIYNYFVNKILVVNFDITTSDFVECINEIDYDFIVMKDILKTWKNILCINEDNIYKFSVDNEVNDKIPKIPCIFKINYQNIDKSNTIDNQLSNSIDNQLSMNKFMFINIGAFVVGFVVGLISAFIF